LIGFFLFEPSVTARFDHTDPIVNLVLLPLKLLFGAFVHIDSFHVLSNLILWAAAGYYLEPKIGSRRLLIIAIIAVLIGGVIETLFFNSKFVGLSSATYCLIGILIWDRFVSEDERLGLLKAVGALVAFIVFDFLFNSVASQNKIAYGAHIGGLMVGFLSSLGFGKGGGNTSARIFRPMVEADIKLVLDIINDHDEDDGEEAEAAFHQSLENKYVVEFEGLLVGMTGYRSDPDAFKTAWLSFTYVHSLFRNKEHAYWMMLELRNVLEANSIEKLFIATSDYMDEDTGEDIYLAARTFYENKLNARREIRIENFYAPGEARYIYSLPVIETRSAAAELPNEDLKARFLGLDQASESETSYVVTWEQDPADPTLPASQLPTKSLGELISEVKTYGGKALFVTLPSHVSENHRHELRDAGFRDLGMLHDYFSQGVGEVHWGLYFD